MRRFRNLALILSISAISASAFLYSNARRYPVLRYRNVTNITTLKNNVVKEWDVAYFIDSPRIGRTFLVMDDQGDGNIFGGRIKLNGSYRVSEEVVDVPLDRDGIDELLVRDGLVDDLSVGSTISSFRPATREEKSWLDNTLRKDRRVRRQALMDYVEGLLSPEIEEIFSDSRRVEV